MYTILQEKNTFKTESMPYSKLLTVPKNEPYYKDSQ